MAIKKFRVNNNSGLAASDGVRLLLSFTINYTADDPSNTQLLTYSLGQGSGGVTFDNGQSSTTQTVNTPQQLNPDVAGSICLKGGNSGTVSITVATSDGSTDTMVVNYTAAMALARGARRLPVLFVAKPPKAAAKKAGAKKAAPKKAAPKKAAKKKPATKKASKKKAASKKAAPKKAAARRSVAKKAGRKKSKPGTIPVLWKKKS